MPSESVALSAPSPRAVTVIRPAGESGTDRDEFGGALLSSTQAASEHHHTSAAHDLGLGLSLASVTTRVLLVGLGG